MIYAPYSPSDKKVLWLISPYVKNKIVYDLGAGEGVLILNLAKEAKRVVAVEIDKDRAEICRSKGLETIEADYMSLDLSPAEVLFVFQGYMGTNHLANKLESEEWKGTVICNSYPLADILKQPKKFDEMVSYKGDPNINLYIYHYRK